jgi:hypothetical protein
MRRGHEAINTRAFQPAYIIACIAPIVNPATKMLGGWRLSRTLANDFRTGVM